MLPTAEPHQIGDQQGGFAPLVSQASLDLTPVETQAGDTGHTRDHCNRSNHAVQDVLQDPADAVIRHPASGRDVLKPHRVRGRNRPGAQLVVELANDRVDVGEAVVARHQDRPIDFCEAYQAARLNEALEEHFRHPQPFSRIGR
ncbi:hypothetical protein D9M68_781590 [compost metagenome]